MNCTTDQINKQKKQKQPHLIWAVDIPTKYMNKNIYFSLLFWNSWTNNSGKKKLKNIPHFNNN